jgi:hypothetical protein
VRARFQIGIVLFAWFIATGAQWDLVQTFAWGRMIAGYSRTMSIADSIRLTFKPDNLCSLCRIVKTAKQQQSGESGAPGSAAVTKAPLIFQSATPVVIAAPACAPWWNANPVAPGIGRTPPPNPPPRSDEA